MRATLKLLFILILLAGISACGQKGGLTRPEQATFTFTQQN